MVNKKQDSNMKKHFGKLIMINLLFIVIFASTNLIFAQPKLAAEITLTPASTSNAETFVTVNGERIISGRSIFSPAEIATSSNAKAKVAIPNTGAVSLAPNSKMNLFFNESTITGIVTSGEITVEIAAGKGLNLTTPDGSVTKSAPAPSSVVVIDFVNGKTRVRTLDGQIFFNGAEIAAGQTSATPAAQPRPDSQSGQTPKKSSNMYIILLVVLAAGGALIGLSAGGGGGGGGGSPPVSPTR